jgi:hypothetical protein
VGQKLADRSQGRTASRPCDKKKSQEWGTDLQDLWTGSKVEGEMR